MGGCSSCLRLLLNEADVKIHVIEPTSIMGGAEHNDSVVVQPNASTLQVPPINRPRTPSDPSQNNNNNNNSSSNNGSDNSNNNGATQLQIPTTTLSIPSDSNEVRTVPVKPKIIAPDSDGQ